MLRDAWAAQKQGRVKFPPVQNLFDNYPDKDRRSIDPNTGLPGNGNQYIDASPFGYNGGFWYVRAGLNF